MNRFLSTFCVGILILSKAYASVTVTGTVTNTNGEGLSYANVTVVGTNVGTASSDDGSYTLLLPSEFTVGQSLTLKAGYIGYITSEVSFTLVSEGNNQNFSLERDVIGSEEVVVTALGISKSKKAFRLCNYSLLYFIFFFAIGLGDRVRGIIEL